MGLTTRTIPPGFDHGRSYLQIGSVVKTKEGDNVIAGVHPKEYSPAHYLNQIEHFLEKRRPWAELWLRNEALYDQDPSAATGYPTSRLSRVNGITHTLESMVYNRRPKLFADSTTGEEVDLARLYEALLNNEWAFLSALKRETRLCVRDNILAGFGAMLTTYDTDFETVLKVREQRNEEIDSAREQGILDSLIAAKMENLVAAGLAHAPEKELTYEWDTRIRKEEVSSLRISYWDVLADPEARHWEQVQWIGRRIEVPLHDLKDGPYENLDSLSPGEEHFQQYWPEHKRRGSKPAETGNAPDLRDYVTVYELFDVRTNQLVAVAPGCEKFLRRQINPYYLAHPYQILQWGNRGEGLFCRSDISVIYNLLREEDILREKLQEAFQREAIDVYIVDQATGLGEENIKGLTGPDGSIFVQVARSDTSRPIQHDVAPLVRQPKSPDILNHLVRVERDIQEGLGVGPNQMGAALKSSTTASEAMEIAGFARSRGEYKYDAVESFVAEVAYARLSHYSQFADEGHILRVAGQKAAELWAGKSFTKGDIQARFTVKVEEGSVRPQNDMTRLATYEKLFLAAMENPILAQVVDLKILFTRWFDALGVKDGDQMLRAVDGNEIAALSQMMALQGAMEGKNGGKQSPTASKQATPARASQGILGRLAGGQV